MSCEGLCSPNHTQHESFYDRHEIKLGNSISKKRQKQFNVMGLFGQFCFKLLTSVLAFTGSLVTGILAYV